MTRLLLLVALVAGCDAPSKEDQIKHCHDHGYSAQNYLKNTRVRCCSVLNGDDVCLHPSDVTRHRRETGQ